MIEPGQFQVNEAWIAFKLNDTPVSTEEDGDFNVLALMDVASCYILGTEFVSTNLTEPSELESRRLIGSGYLQNHEFAKKLFIPTNLVADSLCVEAERHGIAVIHVPEDDVRIVLAFQTNERYYLTDPVHGIPTTENGDESAGKRRLWRSAKRVGPIGRVYYDFCYCDKRFYLETSPSETLGVVVEVPEKDVKKISSC